MAEEGIDISGQRAKSVDDFVQQPFDYVITLCDDANETCPFFPNAAIRLHWSFPDPSLATGTEEERLAVFRASARRHQVAAGALCGTNRQSQRNRSR